MRICDTKRASAAADDIRASAAAFLFAEGCHRRFCCIRAAPRAQGGDRENVEHRTDAWPGRELRVAKSLGIAAAEHAGDREIHEHSGAKPVPHARQDVHGPVQVPDDGFRRAALPLHRARGHGDGVQLRRSAAHPHRRPRTSGTRRPVAHADGRFDRTVARDALVIETIARSAGPLHPFAYIATLSEQARFVERIRRTGPDSMENQLTIDDPVAFVEPWKLTLRYRRVTDLDRLIITTNFCTENDRNPVVNGEVTISPP
jgi:hypothetical protein